MINDILEQNFLLARKIWATNLAKYTTFLVIIQAFSLQKYFTAFIFVMRTIYWHIF